MPEKFRGSGGLAPSYNHIDNGDLFKCVDVVFFLSAQRFRSTVIIPKFWKCRSFLKKRMFRLNSMVFTKKLRHNISEFYRPHSLLIIASFFLQMGCSVFSELLAFSMAARIIDVSADA